MDIEINDPLKISMSVLEIDEHLPSMKFDIQLDVKKFNYSLMISSQTWIQCNDFSAFIEAIQNNKIAILNDMDELFYLEINIPKEKLQWSCAKKDLNGFMTTTKGEEELTDDLKGLVAKLLYHPQFIKGNHDMLCKCSWIKFSIAPI